LINRETGTEVVLQPARWNLYNDFIGRSIRCNRYEWDGSRYGFGFYVEDFIFFPIETTNIDSGFVYQRSAFTNFTVNNINRDWDVQQGEIKFGEITNQIGNISALGTFFIMEQVEIIPATDTSAGEVRSWISSDEYLTCSDGGLVGKIFYP